MNTAFPGHARTAAAGGGCPQPAVPGQEEARAGDCWSQERHRGPRTDCPEGKYVMVVNFGLRSRLL